MGIAFGTTCRVGTERRQNIPYFGQQVQQPSRAATALRKHARDVGACPAETLSPPAPPSPCRWPCQSPSARRTSSSAPRSPRHCLSSQHNHYRYPPPPSPPVLRLLT